jgi:hypothetical protein
VTRKRVSGLTEEYRIGFVDPPVEFFAQFSQQGIQRNFPILYSSAEKRPSLSVF